MWGSSCKCPKFKDSDIQKGPPKSLIMSFKKHSHDWNISSFKTHSNISRGNTCRVLRGKSDLALTMENGRGRKKWAGLSGCTERGGASPTCTWGGQVRHTHVRHTFQPRKDGLGKVTWRWAPQAQAASTYSCESLSSILEIPKYRTQGSGEAESQYLG